MRTFKSSVILSLCLAFFVDAQKSTLSSVQRKTNLAGANNGFIIEVEAASVSSIIGTRSAHETVYDHLNSRGVDFDILSEFNTPDIFVGASVSLKDAADVEKLRDAPGVTAVRPIVRVPRPVPLKSEVVSDASDKKVPADTFSTHRMTGVDKLHAEGYFGKDVTIGILDTGIDYTHPALGGKFGPGNLVIGGYDFVGDAYDGSNAPVPDSDPLDQCAGHGTHVAGIIAAQPNNPLNITGVAPKASLNAYRIFGCEGSVNDDVIVNALLKGFGDGNDILTLSLGGSDGWTESSSSVVASRIAKAGKIVTIAAGNAGASGGWYTSSPGNGLDVISVSSIDNIVIPIQTATLAGASVPHDPIYYYQNDPLKVTDTRPIYLVSNDSTVANDACDPLPDTTPDLAGYVVVVRRGTCAFTQKLDNVVAKGATAVLVYNNAAGFLSASFGDAYAKFPVAIILASDGEFFVDEFNKGSKLTLTFPQEGGNADYPDEHGGLVSDFTSYGPSNDMYFKPAVAAPGGNIPSTWPTTLGSYAVLSGTSMATPFAAGVAGLLFEARGKEYQVGIDARSLFESTAAPVLAEPAGTVLQTLSQQGAGLVDAYQVIHSEITVSPTELLLNDTANFKGEHKIVLTNKSKQTKKIFVKHVPAGTASTFQQDSIHAALGPVPLTESYASVDLSTKSITLGPGKTTNVFVTITPPSADASVVPVYSGFIEFETKGQTLRSSYVGLVGNLKDRPVLDATEYYFGIPIPTLLDASGNVQNGTGAYTLEGTDFPTLLWRNAFGTPHLRADLVSADIDFKATYPKADASRRAFSVGFAESISGSFDDVPTVGPLLEQFYQPRNDEDETNGSPYNTLALSQGTFLNGTAIPAGSYKILLRTLHVTGEKGNEKDYESFLSVPFSVKGGNATAPTSSAAPTASASP
ncbi:subtilisin-like protease [Flagelloscypha sp. PMI_526]|nr:subtilisin-like protease [Flagelloscypha sp. PMI_526]